MAKEPLNPNLYQGEDQTWEEYLEKLSPEARALDEPLGPQGVLDQCAMFGCPPPFNPAKKASRSPSPGESS